MNDNATYINFLEVWHQLADIGSVSVIALVLLIFIYHHIKIVSIKEYKGKYDYINLHEIKTYKLLLILIGVAAALYSNGYNDETAAKSIIWFFVRFFVAGCIGTLIAYIPFLVLQYYYPKLMQKKLDKWRYLPRTNVQTGNKMKLLNEDEENIHLDEGMQAEEDVFSVDYDVWIDDATGETKIERYEGYLEALECGVCGFRALKVVREEVIEPATVDENGQLLKYFECTYCSTKRTTQHTVAKLTNSIAEAAMMKKQVQGEELGNKIEGIKLEISQEGISKNYEFNSIEQAKTFLEEYAK